MKPFFFLEKGPEKKIYKMARKSSWRPCLSQTLIFYKIYRKNIFDPRHFKVKIF
jgi:hypothetical protein